MRPKERIISVAAFRDRVVHHALENIIVPILKQPSEQRQRTAKQKKTRIAESFIRRAIQRGFRFQYLLWDSWYNSSSSMRFVFGSLFSRGIHLVAMIKRDAQKYLCGGRYLTVSELYRKAGKWQRNKITGIMYKSIVVEVLDKQSSRKPESQAVLGSVRMCFFRYPEHKKYKALICTNLSLSEMEILGVYLHRWSIEVVFKHQSGWRYHH
ncbi:MAG: transposase [Candidatus Cloacimonetes bacterium]|nr:transposase [Candidatus Cloacimonadota bacterium]